MEKQTVAKKYGQKLAAVGTAVAFAPTMALADYSTLTDAVDWTDVGVAIFAVAAAVAGILVIRRGVGMVLGAIAGRR